ncbi:putative transcriptional regulatory protein [Lachnellula suecica]|uniref:Transcriptional activator of proteases prtT n=1 Tax=Lachnellula suecica TaxID=602035 RepID=A0A8T9CMB5_9HELO|nr:putative transcriptional regulatory protein [Lachnellula suecica]
MPPDRGRASRACATCRKIKTRCYEPENPARGCLRCDRLEQPCSLSVNAVQRDLVESGHLGAATIGSSQDDRLEKTVSELVARMDQNATQGAPLGNPRQIAMVASPRQPDLRVLTERTTSTAAPVFLIRDVASEIGVRQPSSPEEQFASSQSPSDIISKGFMSSQEAAMLLELFQEHYGRWVCFQPKSSPKALLTEIRTSPLLICACCLIAVRHTTQDSASKLAPRLFEEAKKLLSTSLLVVPQTIDFFQATVIMSMWSTTIGQVPMSIDSWLVSGFALQHALAAPDLFGPMSITGHSNAMRKSNLDRMCIYNHLCLVHLQCRDILGSDQATNFETRMVAEINLYWIIYESCSSSSLDLPKTQKLLQEWKNEWRFLFDQPRSQFVQMGFHFAQLLTYDQSLKSRSAAVRESLLSEMVSNSVAIINQAIGTADDRTRHLSDHIYHIITFSAVTLCRLLNMYEQQLSALHNISELDTLILSLVTWLHSIGLPCHAGHTLGDVVSGFHAKLRPNSHPSPYAIPWTADDDLALYFPELLGVESFDFQNSNLLPNWEPYAQGSAYQ